jgi:HPt (histidine-containing phosphotransfer) domain-containing protein
MIKLKNILNEGSLTNYYSRSETPTKAAAKKVDAALQKLTKDKKELDMLVELITDLVDEYAIQRVDDYQAEKY